MSLHPDGSFCQRSVCLGAWHGTQCGRNVPTGGSAEAHVAPSHDRCFRGRYADSSIGFDSFSRSGDECDSALTETGHWRGDWNVHRFDWICEQWPGCPGKGNGARTRVSLRPANPGVSHRFCGDGMAHDSSCSRCSRNRDFAGFGCRLRLEPCVWPRPGVRHGSPNGLHMVSAWVMDCGAKEPSSVVWISGYSRPWDCQPQRR